MSTLTTLTALVTGVAQPMSFGGPHAGDGPPFPIVLIPLFWLLREIDETDYRSRRAVLREKE